MSASSFQLETVTATESYRKACEDRVAVFRHDERTVIVVADGAGGTGSGEVAAETVIREVEGRLRETETAEQWADALRQIDHSIFIGESTAVVVDVRAESIVGASVGDSQAWQIYDGSILELTQHQKRKPLLGSGSCEPVALTGNFQQGLLLVATDGFCNYAKREAIVSILAKTDFYAVPRRCIEAVTLPSGDLWDDIGIVAARRKPHYATRKRYEI